MKHLCRGAAMALATTLVLVVGLSNTPQAHAEMAQGPGGKQTSVGPTPGKGIGSRTWGVVGDIETIPANDSKTFNYGIGINPATGALVVSDSGKVGWGRLECLLMGQSGAPCQAGTPRVFSYPLRGAAAGDASEVSLTSYGLNGSFLTPTTAAGSTSTTWGLGRRYATGTDSLSGRSVHVYPTSGTPNIGHGPRGIAFANGTTFVVDSEASAPYSRTGEKVPVAITTFNDALTVTGAVGYAPSGPAGQTWALRNEPGVHFYRAGATTNAAGEVVVNSETSDRLQVYGADGTWRRSILLDVPANTAFTGDAGYRNPQNVAAGSDGSYYISLNNFRDDAPWRALQPYLEKRDAKGAIISTPHQFQFPSYWRKGQVVMGAAVEPRTGHVFGWTQMTDGIAEWDAEGTFIRSYLPSEFPGLTTVRGVTFDSFGRLYATVAEGTSSARVMILGTTPSAITGTCAQWNNDKTQIKLSWQCQDGTEAGLTPYTSSPVVDYLVEMSTDDGTTWKVVPTTQRSTLKERTLSGLDPGVRYKFRVSAWNEAGNGDWMEFVPTQTAPGVDDSATTAQGTPVTIDVGANDPLPVRPGELALLDPAGNATATLTSDEGVWTVVEGKVRFIPAAGFVGTTAPVRYRSGQTECAWDLEATITVSVAAPSPPPSSHPSATSEAPTSSAPPASSDSPTQGPTATPTQTSPNPPESSTLATRASKPGLPNTGH